MSPSTWRPAAEEPGPRRVGESLDGVVRSLGGAGAGALASVFGRWDEMVGESVAAHVRPVALRGTTLVVAVDQPGWATQLRWLEADLLARLAEGLGSGVVESFQVRVEGG